MLSVLWATGAVDFRMILNSGLELCKQSLLYTLKSKTLFSHIAFPPRSIYSVVEMEKFSVAPLCLRITEVIPASHDSLARLLQKPGYMNQSRIQSYLYILCRITVKLFFLLIIFFWADKAITVSSLFISAYLLCGTKVQWTRRRATPCLTGAKGWLSSWWRKDYQNWRSNQVKW